VAKVAEAFGAAVNTIRDIWNRKSWVSSTRDQWTAEEEAMYMKANPNAKLQSKDAKDDKRNHSDATSNSGDNSTSPVPSSGSSMASAPAPSVEAEAPAQTFKT